MKNETPGQGLTGADAYLESPLPPDLSSKTILLVEDMEINQEVATAILEPTQAHIIIANNGEAALHIVKEKSTAIDAILMDIQMPGMDGFECTRRIRSYEDEMNSDGQNGRQRPGRRHIPIIAMTANAFTEDIQKCLDCGMDAHIGKPIAPADLFAALQKWISI
jgi:CheY-like chemotaxis protein